MLLLPFVQIEDLEINLPATEKGIVELCNLVSDPDNAAYSWSELFRREPGILLFFLVSFFERTSNSIASLKGLSDWIVRDGLSRQIESLAFSTRENLTESQANVLWRWSKSKTRKNLRRILQVFSGLDTRQSKNFLRLAIEPAAISELSIHVNENEETNFFSKTSSNGLPLRQLWLATSKIQKLQTQFEQKLFDEKSKSLKHLAYGASHEINNPLANIASRAQSLMELENRISKKQQLAIIYSQAMRAHEMISDMMLFANPPEPLFEKVELLVVAKKVRDELHAELKSTQIDLSIRQYPEVPVCEFDPTQIMVALKALVKNSMIAIGSAGEIRIQIWRQDANHVGISVIDNGCGVDKSIVDEIFEPYFSGREAGRGIGFGLSKAWRIFQLHHGQIVLDSEYRDGARFVGNLPIRQCSGEKKVSRIDNLRAA